MGAAHKQKIKKIHIPLKKFELADLSSTKVFNSVLQAARHRSLFNRDKKKPLPPFSTLFDEKKKNRCFLSHNNNNNCLCDRTGISSTAFL